MSHISSLVPLLDKIFYAILNKRNEMVSLHWFGCIQCDAHCISVYNLYYVHIRYNIFVLKLFSISIIWQYCILSDALLCLQKWSEGFYPLLYWFVYVELSWMETNLIMLKCFLMSCWIGLLVFCWEFLHLCLSGILVIACSLLPLCVSLLSSIASTFSDFHALAWF